MRPLERSIAQTLTAAYAGLTTHTTSLYGTAALRIGYGTAYLVFLLHEYPHHDALWGPDAPWTPAMNRQFAYDTSLNWFAADRWWYTFLGHGGRLWFEVLYHLAIVVCVLFTLGWRTRATSILFAATIAMFTGRDVFLTDGGDNIMGLMAIYLVFAACGRRWSLDSRRSARRRGRRGSLNSRLPRGLTPRPAREPFAWPDTPGGRVLAELDDTRSGIVTFLHNCAVLVIAAQICVVYAAAGLYKAQGSTWQDGTALYYALRLDWFRPWPGLSNAVAAHSVLIAIVAYLTVLVQIAFPIAVFSRPLKYPCLFVLLGMHFSIAVVMGLPLFSFAMMIGDAVFIPDRHWMWIGGLVRRRTALLRARIPSQRAPRVVPPPAPAPSALPAHSSPSAPSAPSAGGTQPDSGVDRQSALVERPAGEHDLDVLGKFHRSDSQVGHAPE